MTTRCLDCDQPTTPPPALLPDPVDRLCPACTEVAVVLLGSVAARVDLLTARRGDTP